MRHITSRPLQPADNQLPLLLLAHNAECGAGQQRLVTIAQPQCGFAFALGFTCGGGRESEAGFIFTLQFQQGRLFGGGHGGSQLRA